MHILAFDDAGTVANPIEIPLSANQALHFNAGDLENGNTAKDIEAIGRPGRGDCAWIRQAPCTTRVGATSGTVNSIN